MADQLSLQFAATNGRLIAIDRADVDLSECRWSAYAHRSTYYAISKRGYLHRLILERILGRPLLSAELVDHIDGDGLNNRRENLRLSNTAQNCRNSKLSKANTSGYKGVSRSSRGNTWHAQITVDWHNYSLGYFATAEEAAIAYNHAAVDHFGEFAAVNDIAGWRSTRVTPIKPYTQPRKNCPTGYIGITRRGGKWMARITINGKRICLGRFDSLELAYQARCRASAGDL